MANVLELHDVSFVRDGNTILDSVSWYLASDQRWVVLGPNGAGKSTLLLLLAARQHPSSGTVTLLGERLGRTDVFDLRPRIGFAASAMARLLPPEETVLNSVMTAAYAVSGRWRERYEQQDEQRARDVLNEWRLGELAERRFGTLSDGEQKRVQIARAVMTDPEVLLLDEPAASLDVGAREEFISLIGGYASSPKSPAMVVVTHHVEEIPEGFTHALVLSQGRVHAAGPLDETVTSAVLSEAFGVALNVSQNAGRFSARAA